MLVCWDTVDGRTPRPPYTPHLGLRWCNIPSMNNVQGAPCFSETPTVLEARLTNSCTHVEDVSRRAKEFAPNTQQSLGTLPHLTLVLKNGM